MSTGVSPHVYNDILGLKECRLEVCMLNAYCVCKNDLLKVVDTVTLVRPYENSDLKGSVGIGLENRLRMFQERGSQKMNLLGSG